MNVGMEMRVVRLPNRRGLYMIVLEGDRLHVVARLLGNSADRQDIAQALIERWVDARGGDGS